MQKHPLWISSKENPSFIENIHPKTTNSTQCTDADSNTENSKQTAPNASYSNVYRYSIPQKTINHNIISTQNTKPTDIINDSDWFSNTVNHTSTLKNQDHIDNSQLRSTECISYCSNPMTTAKGDHTQTNNHKTAKIDSPAGKMTQENDLQINITQTPELKSTPIFLPDQTHTNIPDKQKYKGALSDPISSKDSYLTKMSSYHNLEPIQFSHSAYEDDSSTHINSNINKQINWKVWKFGGTSMGSATRISNVAQLVCQESQLQTDLVVVVSAVNGVTSALQACCDKAVEMSLRKLNGVYISSDNDKFQTTFKEDLTSVVNTHLKIMEDLYEQSIVSGSCFDCFNRDIQTDMNSILAILFALELSGKCLKDLSDFVIGQGEIWSSKILYACLPHFLSKLRLGHTHEGLNSLGPDRRPFTQTLVIDSCDPEIPNSPSKKSHLPFGKNLDSSTFTKFKLHSVENSNITNSSSQDLVTYTHLADTREFLIVYDRSDPETQLWANNYTKDQVFLDWKNSTLNFDLYLQKIFSLHPTPSRESLPSPFESPLSPSSIDVHIETKNPHYLIIMPGFICSYPNGSMTNFSRNGSDYSASLISALLKAKELTIWSDVDGIYSADPRVVPDAVFIEQLSYKEALELSYFGAQVLHPFSILPCIQNDISILLRSSFSPSSRGSTICSASHKSTDASKLGCKAFSMISNISLITLEGTHMIGVAGIASKLFSAVHTAHCSIILISQGSSEHSICIAIRTKDLKPCLLSIKNAFNIELLFTKTMDLYYTEECTILSAVGDGMSGHIGTLSKLSTALSQASVNIKAITQGPSEHNISFVVSQNDGIRGLRALHNSIYKQQSFEHKKQHTASLTPNEVPNQSPKNSPPPPVAHKGHHKPRALTTRKKYIKLPNLGPRVRLW